MAENYEIYVKIIKEIHKNLIKYKEVTEALIEAFIRKEKVELEFKKEKNSDFSIGNDKMRELAEERYHEIQREHAEFLAAKRQGIRALVEYKLSRAKFRNKLNALEKREKQVMDAEKQKWNKVQVDQYVEMLKKGHYVMDYGAHKDSKELQIMSHGMNYLYTQDKIKKLQDLQNQLNTLQFKNNFEEMYDKVMDQIGRPGPEIYGVADDLAHARHMKDKTMEEIKMKQLMKAKQAVNDALKEQKRVNIYSRNGLYSS
jgi:cation transport regulator ChaC